MSQNDQAHFKNLAAFADHFGASCIRGVKIAFLNSFISIPLLILTLYIDRPFIWVFYGGTMEQKINIIHERTNIVSIFQSKSLNV